MEYVCDRDKCTGCKACLEICKYGALSFSDNIEFTVVKIDKEKCVGCDACKRVCQGNKYIKTSKPIIWKQGWGSENIRRSSSSGGLASQIMKKFISNDSFVCSCIFKDGEFIYYVTNLEAELEWFKGSKYVKSNPDKIYSQIRNLLKNGYRVLFIGLPCHVAALKLFLGGLYDEHLYTIDLICHGTPSSKVLELFLGEHNIDIRNINNIAFRRKNSFDISINSETIVQRGTIDKYTLGFLRGLFYTENCYYCKYAQIGRVSDLTLGDSWGTDLKDQEGLGVSLALCQTEKGKFLLENSDLTLYDVDIDNAIKENHQLREASRLPNERVTFFSEFNKSKSVEKAVFICYPKDCIKQKVKSFMKRIHIIRGNSK